MNIDSLKYNYVIIGDVGYYLTGYKDVIGLMNVSYHANFYDGFDGKIKRSIVKLNFSKKVNKFVRTPFSSYVWPRIYPHHFTDNKPVCYLFFAHPYIVNSTYLNFLRKKNPDTKLVLFFQDLVRRNPLMDIKVLKQKMDLVLSYDKGDCKQYDLYFHPTPMSYTEVPDYPSLRPCDVYFCGFAKSRWQTVHDIYICLCRLGLSCDINLVGMPADAPHIDGIHYHARPFSYTENLQHVIKSKCVLEVMQDGADGFTPRLWESIMYDRHLLTNNSIVRFSDFYHPAAIHQLTDIENGRIRRWINNPIPNREAKKNELSPVHLLKFIDNLL